MSEKNEFLKHEKMIEEDYPEAYIYYCMGKIFGWSPNVVDDLDLDLCRVLIAIEKKVNEKIDEGIDGKHPKFGKRHNLKEKANPFLEEWKDMSVKDIIDSDKFKRLQEKDGQVYMAMQGKAGHVLGIK